MRKINIGDTVFIVHHDNQEEFLFENHINRDKPFRSWDGMHKVRA